MAFQQFQKNPLENLRNIFRMRNIFGLPPTGSPQEPDIITTPPIRAQQETPKIDVFGGDFEPQSRASNEAYELLKNMPIREKPSVARRIGASLVNIGMGPEATEQSLYGPYNREMLDWKMKFEPMMDIANQERYYNANMRQLAQTILTDQYRQKQLELQKEIEERRREVAEAQIARDTQRTEIAERRLNLLLPEAERLQRQLDNSLAQIAARGDEARRTQAQSISQRGAETRKTQSERITQQAEETRRTQAERIAQRPKVSTTGTTAQSETQRKQGIINRANELVRQNPALKDYIIYNESTKLPEFKNVEGRRGIFGMGAKPGLTPEKIKQYNDYLNGNPTNISTTPDEGKVEMLKPDGTRVRIKREDLQKAIAAGYKEIK